MYYPINLRLDGKKVIVFGGGRVAYRKLKNLLRAGARVRLISEDVMEEIKELEPLEIILDSYNEKYLKGAYMVIGATSNRGVNLDIAKACEKLNILCNIVDNKEVSSFITPSIVTTEGLLFSISTRGKYPALSKLIRKDLEERYKKYSVEYMGLLEALRGLAIDKYPREKGEIINKALSLNIEELEEFYIKLQEGVL